LAFILSTVLASVHPQAARAVGVLYGHVDQVERTANSPNSFPLPGFEGEWLSQTEVVDSSCQAVAIGTSVTSTLRFARTRCGAINAEWEQPGWSNTHQRLTPVNNCEGYMGRVNYGTDDNLGCAERSYDYYTQTGPNEMTVSSTVDVFQDDGYVGRYQTKSTLTRMIPEGPSTLCHHRSKDPDDQTTTEIWKQNH
jgi:hypothetical protein